MAGSLNHIVGDGGEISFELIDNMCDAYEALEEMYALVIELSGGDMMAVSAACDKLGFVDPWRTSDRHADEPTPAAMRAIKKEEIKP